MTQRTASSSSEPAPTCDHEIDAICDRFEERLKAGDSPGLGAFLHGIESTKRKSLFRELLRLEYWYARRTGIAPRLEVYREEFSEYAEVLESVRQEFAAQKAEPAEAPQRETITTSTRYVNLRDRQAGGLGEVFRATDEELRRDAAVKFIQRRCCDDPLYRSKFLAEAEVTGRLDHPGIVPVYGHGEAWDGRPFYVMRFIPGADFGEEIRKYHESQPEGGNERGRRLQFHDLVGHLVSACETVAYAHSRGVLHCDIKPANIRVGRYGETIVVDWGLAYLVERNPEDKASGELTLRVDGLPAGQTDSGNAFGTPSYMSPEQTRLCGAPIRQVSDIYSLGATLYTLLTGKPPFPHPRSWSDFENLEKQIIIGRFPRPRDILRRCPRPLEAICLKAMSLEPTSRYRTALDLARDLRSWMADKPVTAYKEPIRERLARLARRHFAWFLAVLVVATLVMVMSLTWSAGESRRASREAQLRRQTEEARLSMLRTSAVLAAEAYSGEMSKRWYVLTQLASDPALCELLRPADPSSDDPEAWQPIQQWLETATSDYLTKHRVSCFFVNDASSRQVARHPYAKGKTIGVRFGYRAYFHGGPEDYPEDRESLWQDRLPTDHRVLSPPFPSKTDDYYKVAFSVPVWDQSPAIGNPDESNAPLGILAMSVELPELAACLDNKFIEGNVGIVLVNLGSDRLEGDSPVGLVLDHPDLVLVSSDRGAEGKQLPRVSDVQQLERLRLLRFKTRALHQRRRLLADAVELQHLAYCEDFRDPLAGEREPGSRAAFWPVFVEDTLPTIDTGWIVVVEDRMLGGQASRRK